MQPGLMCRWWSYWLWWWAGQACCAHGRQLRDGDPAVPQLLAGRLGGPTPPPKIYISPGVPSGYQSSYRFQNNYLASMKAGEEAQSARYRAASSDSLEVAADAQLMATRQEVQTQQAATLETIRARRVEALSNQARTVLAGTQKFLGLIPDIAKKAVKRAIADVEQETIQKMNQEVARAAAAAQSEAAVSTEGAADAAQRAALPYQLGKLRAEQTMVLYIERGREFATAVGELKQRAMEIAETSVPLQAKGQIVVAQQLQMEAHDLMDKALQMEAKAKGLASTAKQIQQGLQAFDDAAQEAAAYGAYQANPASLDDPTSIPKPPFPLTLHLAALPVAGFPAPAPAPGMAMAPAPAAAA